MNVLENNPFFTCEEDSEPETDQAEIPRTFSSVNTNVNKKPKNIREKKPK